LNHRNNGENAAIPTLGIICRPSGTQLAIFYIFPYQYAVPLGLFHHFQVPEGRYIGRKPIWINELSPRGTAYFQTLAP